MVKVNNAPSFPYLSDPSNILNWARSLASSLAAEFTYHANRSNALLPGDGSEAAIRPVLLASYTVATLPSASTYVQGIIYVSDGTSNKRLAVSDGTNWRWPDGAVVS